MSMKLYNAQLSPYSARVRMAIYAKGIDVTLVDAFSDPMFMAELSRLSPLQKVPVLVHGDVVLPESEVICEYLEDIGIGPSLRPDDVAGRARTRLLARIGDLYIMAPMTMLFGHINPRGRDQAFVDRTLAALHEGMGWLDHYFTGSRYAVGDKLSTADCALVPILFFYKQIGPLFGYADPFANCKFVRDYYASLQNDPHAARVIDEIDTSLRRVMGVRG